MHLWLPHSTYAFSFFSMKNNDWNPDNKTAVLWSLTYKQSTWKQKSDGDQTHESFVKCKRKRWVFRASSECKHENKVRRAKCVIDDNDMTFWFSDKVLPMLPSQLAPPQYLLFSFDSPTDISSIEITFQGGFASEVGSVPFFQFSLSSFRAGTTMGPFRQ